MSSYTPLLTNEKGVNEHGLKVILWSCKSIYGKNPSYNSKKW